MKAPAMSVTVMSVRPSLNQKNWTEHVVNCYFCKKEGSSRFMDWASWKNDDGSVTGYPFHARCFEIQKEKERGSSEQTFEGLR